MLLLIPGPVSTHPAVKAAMTRDIAPWDDDFRALYASVRSKLLALAEVDPAVHAVLPLQGCGHFGMEAAIRTMVPADTGRLLVPLTGSYGVRMARLAREAGRHVIELPIPPFSPIEPSAVAAALRADAAITHVGLVYSETSTGVVHDPAAVGAVVRAAGRAMIVDAVSAFGALPLALAAQPEIQAVVFTSNKCLEGMPGLSFTLARIDALERATPAGSWCLDLGDLFRHTRGHGAGTFRFTPPAQVLAACEVALDLHRQEGGAAARLARYRANSRALRHGMEAIGLIPYLAPGVQGPIVMNVRAPDDPAWSLQHFVRELKDRGFLISNFFDTPEPSFRVGCIGQVTEADMHGFVTSVDMALSSMGVQNRGPARRAA